MNINICAYICYIINNKSETVINKKYVYINVFHLIIYN